MTFYDIHSHNSSDNEDVITVKSIDLGVADDAVFVKEEIRNRKNGLFSVGIHPWHPDTGKISELREMAKSGNVVAVGETGLDKLKSGFETQKELFELQIRIAEEARKPLIIHCVRAWNELLEMKRRFKPSVAWLIHGFRGNSTLALQLMNNGLYLSFGKNFNPEALRKVWEAKRLFIETDDGDSDIREIYTDIAKGLSISVPELSTGTGAVFRQIVLDGKATQEKIIK
jgi:TatD DNase family protein